jgi:hypothetical protein
MTTEHENAGCTVQCPPEEYFGVCPQCAKNDGYLNVRRAHWMVCHTHRVRWWVGENLFSTWKMESEGDWAENHAILARYAEVEPLMPPTEEADWNPLPELVAGHASDHCLKVRRPIDFIKILEMREQGTVLELGRVVATSGALAHLTLDEVRDALVRHRAGDWGNVDPADRLANDAAVREGSRVLSSYLAKDATKFWVITEADRSATTVLLPEEY